MSLVEFAQRLESSFNTSRRLLTRLLEGLHARRTAWISLRPEQVKPADELDALALELQREDAGRRELLAQLSTLLPTPAGIDTDDTHVNVSRVADAIPPLAARGLRKAADEATTIATRVRRELALGKRLLGFAQRAQESLMSDFDPGQDSAPKGYDRNARSSRGLGHVTAGHLVDGRM